MGDEHERVRHVGGGGEESNGRASGAENRANRPRSESGPEKRNKPYAKVGSFRFALHRALRGCGDSAAKENRRRNSKKGIQEAKRNGAPGGVAATGEEAWMQRGGRRHAGPRESERGLGTKKGYAKKNVEGRQRRGVRKSGTQGGRKRRNEECGLPVAKRKKKEEQEERWGFAMVGGMAKGKRKRDAECNAGKRTVERNRGRSGRAKCAMVGCARRKGAGAPDAEFG